MAIKLSPLPEKSPITSSAFIIGLDWLRYIRDMQTYISKLLNRYDGDKSGIVALVAGSVSIPNASVTAASYIRMSVQTPGGTQGILSAVVTPGVGIVITSTNALDTSSVLYEIVEVF